jgi:hypothetical protein
MLRYIGVYVKTCNVCNRAKLQHWQPSGELHPTDTPEERWEVISVNFIIELPDSHGHDAIMNIVNSVSKQGHCNDCQESHGYDAIMNVVDSVTKRAHFIPMHTTITAEGAA